MSIDTERSPGAGPHHRDRRAPEEHDARHDGDDRQPLDRVAGEQHGEQQAGAVQVQRDDREEPPAPGVGLVAGASRRCPRRDHPRRRVDGAHVHPRQEEGGLAVDDQAHETGQRCGHRDVDHRRTPQPVGQHGVLRRVLREPEPAHGLERRTGSVLDDARRMDRDEQGHAQGDRLEGEQRWARQREPAEGLSEHGPGEDRPQEHHAEADDVELACRSARLAGRPRAHDRSARQGRSDQRGRPREPGGVGRADGVTEHEHGAGEHDDEAGAGDDQESRRRQLRSLAAEQAECRSPEQRDGRQHADDREVAQRGGGCGSEVEEQETVGVDRHQPEAPRRAAGHAPELAAGDHPGHEQRRERHGPAGVGPGDEERLLAVDEDPADRREHGDHADVADCGAPEPCRHHDRHVADAVTTDARDQARHPVVELRRDLPGHGAHAIPLGSPVVLRSTHARLGQSSPAPWASPQPIRLLTRWSIGGQSDRMARRPAAGGDPPPAGRALVGPGRPTR